MMGSISWCSEQLPLSDDVVVRRRREEKGRRGTDRGGTLRGTIETIERRRVLL